MIQSTREQLHRRGLSESIYQAYVPGKPNYAAEITELQAADVAVAFIGGYDAEIALMARTAHDRAYPIQLVTAVSLASEQFGLVAGPGAEGVLFLDVADARGRPEAAPIVERFRASGYEPEGYTLNAYAAVQVWAQAEEKTGSLELPAMIASLREQRFDTVLGPIDFDDKGDLTVQNPVWYVWRGGTYVPLEQDTARE
jgi:branched-chain amino acid transport system substrate-binding protein